jgi:hypothetical protein
MSHAAVLVVDMMNSDDHPDAELRDAARRMMESSMSAELTSAVECLG